VSHDVALEGCRRQPLADYLKALGVFRLVAEQIDPAARAWWSGGVLHLRSALDREALLEFFATRYAPTPMVAPWNGGSGFYDKDNQDGIEAIERSTAERFAAYRQAIATCRELVVRAGLAQRPDADAKPAFLEQVRAAVTDDALPWIDAAVALEEDGPAYPPLLGTGGNDGRLDFSNNQMQRLAELLIAGDGARSLLNASLFAAPEPRLVDVAIGQFRPSSAGGANAGAGFDRGSLVNPWDYVLALEGALVFAVAVTRRVESAAPGDLSFPFTVRASGAGYGSAARSDEESANNRHEMWLPLWSRPASHGEIRALFGEGRAKVGPRAARTGVDFARAIASLGVDRGIDEFVRVGFLVRNGLAYFATPLGEWSVARVPTSELLVEIDSWLARLGRAAGGKNAPSALRRAASRVDDAILALCRRGEPRQVGDLLIALGGVEAVCARSPGARDAVPPLPALDARWLAAADDDSAELRLAAALATAGLRRYLSPAIPRGKTFIWGPSSGDHVWAERSLVDNLVAVARRRESRDERPALSGPLVAGAADVAAFLAGETDDERLEALLWGLCSLGPGNLSSQDSGEDRALPAVFALCRLALERKPKGRIELPLTRGIVGRLASGDSAAATRLAIRRLRGAGLLPRCGPIEIPPAIARRCAAALVFPLGRSVIAAALQQLIRTTSLKEQLDHGPHRP
jgi:CRISPR-associated protein Csx17